MSRRGMVYSGEQRTCGTLGAGVVAALLIVVPACSTSSYRPRPPLPPLHRLNLHIHGLAAHEHARHVPAGFAAEVSDCGADAKSLEVALQTYMATQGAYPSPPSAWSAATYVANFGPLTSPQGSIGPSLQHAPATTFYCESRPDRDRTARPEERLPDPSLRPHRRWSDGSTLRRPDDGPLDQRRGRAARPDRAHPATQSYVDPSHDSAERTS